MPESEILAMKAPRDEFDTAIEEGRAHDPA